MDSGYYAAFSGLLARTQALDTSASNLSNSDTTGFRASRGYFRSLILGPNGADSEMGQALNRFGLLGGNRLSTAEGTLRETGNPLDLAIEGDGFFSIQTERGIRFTRDGSFHRSQAGLLVTAENEAVLSTTRQPLAIPPGAVAVGIDGALSVAGAVVGSVGVFQFSPGTELSAEGANRYVAPQNAPAPELSKATIHQGALESANEDVIQGSLNLIMMQRQAEMMQKALTVFHTEFNKTASEDLPKVQG